MASKSNINNHSTVDISAVIGPQNKWRDSIERILDGEIARTGYTTYFIFVDIFNQLGVKIYAQSLYDTFYFGVREPSWVQYGIGYKWDFTVDLY